MDLLKAGRWSSNWEFSTPDIILVQEHWLSTPNLHDNYVMFVA